jgi:transcriptional regulator with XRE-family HTH domain
LSTAITHPGQELRARREALGLPRTEVARLAGCSNSMLREIECGVIPKRGRVLPAVLAVLDRHEAGAQVTA